MVAALPEYRKLFRDLIDKIALFKKPEGN